MSDNTSSLILDRNNNLFLINFTRKIKNDLEKEFVGKDKNEISERIKSKFNEEREKLIGTIKYYKSPVFILRTSYNKKSNNGNTKKKYVFVINDGKQTKFKESNKPFKFKSNQKNKKFKKNIIIKKSQSNFNRINGLNIISPEKPIDNKGNYCFMISAYHVLFSIFYNFPDKKKLFESSKSNSDELFNLLKNLLTGKNIEKQLLNSVSLKIKEKKKSMPNFISSQCDTSEFIQYFFEAFQNLYKEISGLINFDLVSIFNYTASNGKEEILLENGQPKHKFNSIPSKKTNALEFICPSDFKILKIDGKKKCIKKNSIKDLIGPTGIKYSGLTKIETPSGIFFAKDVKELIQQTGYTGINIGSNKIYIKENDIIDNCPTGYTGLIDLKGNYHCIDYNAIIGPTGINNIPINIICPTGYTAINGPSGIYCVDQNGITGAINFSCATGYSGATGSNGSICLGPTGTNYPIQTNCPTGYTAINGPSGTICVSETGLTGPIGLTCDNGYTGFTGSNGYIYCTGPTGINYCQNGFTGINTKEGYYCVSETGLTGMCPTGYTGINVNSKYICLKLSSLTGTIEQKIPTGATGMTGTKGIIYAKEFFGPYSCETGYTGINGPTGINCVNINDLTGPIDIKCPTGYTGTIGKNICEKYDNTLKNALDFIWKLAVDNKIMNINEIIKNSTNEEVINITNFEKQKKNVSSITKKMYIVDPSEFLMINFKLYDTGSKFMNFKFNNKLDDDILIPYYEKNSLSIKNLTYIFNDIILHNGTKDSGHYICLSKRGDNWYLFNDKERIIYEYDNFNDLQNKGFNPVFVLLKKKN